MSNENARGGRFVKGGKGGPGRPKGQTNYLSVKQLIIQNEIDPIGNLKAILDDPKCSLDLKVKINTELARYISAHAMPKEEKEPEPELEVDSASLELLAKA